MNDKRTLIMIALGEVSRCWSNTEGAGIFQSWEALKIGEKLIEDLDKLEKLEFGDK